MKTTMETQGKIEAVLLDLDGTLIDAFGPIVRAMKQTLKEYGLPDMSDMDIQRHTGRGDCSMRDLFGDKQDEATIRFMEIHDETYLQKVKIMPYAEQMLKDLKAYGIPTAIVTSKGQQRAEAQLDVIQWAHYFGALIGKQADRKSKPDPDPIFLACKRLGVSPEKAVMIGDGVADMKAAQRAGCFAIGLTHNFSGKELREHGANICFKTLNEVNNWLKTKMN